VLTSQAVIFTAWSDAMVGTLANLFSDGPDSRGRMSSPVAEASN
jgi:hypothetical protein